MNYLLLKKQNLFSAAFLSLFAVISFYLFSQNSLQIKTDNYVMQQMQASYTPGIAVGVISHGKVLLAKGYGLSNVELATFVDSNSIFQLLSVSKQFIAAAVMLLNEKGEISLDQSIAFYLPDVPSSWKKI